MVFQRKKKSTSNSRDIIPEQKVKRNRHPNQIAQHFKPGQVMNPAGRPKGSRNKLGEAFLLDFLEEWEKNGKAALSACRLQDPARFCSIAASLLPKEIQLGKNDGAFDRFLESLSDSELEQFANGIMAFGAKQIEGSHS